MSRIFHDSGCFCLRNENGVLVNKMPRGVNSFRVHFPNGRIKDLHERVYYVKPGNILEVLMEGDFSRYFVYSEQGFTEVAR